MILHQKSVFFDAVALIHIGFQRIAKGSEQGSIQPIFQKKHLF
ncbi:MAG: hypothetical protein ACJAWV_000287 [Flammeovirgaceae bacterium]|jgi:hypothetical protein